MFYSQIFAAIPINFAEKEGHKSVYNDLKKYISHTTSRTNHIVCENLMKI